MFERERLMTGGNFSGTSPQCGSTGFRENCCVRWIFILSCFALSVLFEIPSVVSLIGNVLALAAAYYLTFRKKILEHVFCRFSRKTFCVTLIFTLVAVGFHVPLVFRRLSVLLDLFPAIPIDLLPTVPTYIAIYLFLFLTTAPAFFVFFYAFVPRFSCFISEIYKTSDHVERRFFAAIMLIGMIAITVIYNQTNCFHAPHTPEGRIILYDIVYTSDSGEYYLTNVYGCIGAKENDIRQPLFGLFALPFAVVATFLSWIFYILLPNSGAIFIQMIQIGLLFVTYTFMSRLMRLNGLAKAFFFSTLVLTYPVLLFSLMWEQYIFSIFWLWVFIYIANNDGQTNSFAFVAATGSLVTNAVAFLLTFTKDWRRFLRNGVDCILTFLFFFIICGKLGTLNKAFNLSDFTGVTLTFYDKFLQYANFVSSCWIFPEIVIHHKEMTRDCFFPQESAWLFSVYCYHLAPVQSLNLPGLALLGLSLLGFLLNYKDKFARICAFWVAYSFFILCIVGWGTAENGLTLYTLYFGWAYFCLVFLAIEKLLQKLPIVKYSVYVVWITALAYINLPGIYDVIQFGIKHYPC
jgi:hypothetical protein